MFVKNTKIESIADAVKQVVEASPVKIPTSTGTRVLGTSYGNSAKTHRDQISDPFAAVKGPGKKDLENIEKPKKKQESFSAFTNKLLNSLEEDKQIQKQIDEVLKKDASAGEWIHDFVHSDNPKFAGKSKAERKKMALGAYYAKQNEEVEQIDEVGNTPAGQAALRAVSARGDKGMSDWNKKPESGYSSAPKKTIRQFAGAMNADRRLKGQGITKGKEGQAQRQIDYAKKMRGEEVEQFDEALIGNQKKIDKNHNGKIDAQDFKILRGKKVDEVLNPSNKTIDTLAGRSKKVPAEAKLDNSHTSAKTQLKSEAKTPEHDDVPFDPPYRRSSDVDTVTDKSGAKHTPMSRAKHLAQTALQRVKSDLKAK